MKEIIFIVLATASLAMNGAFLGHLNTEGLIKNAYEGLGYSKCQLDYTIRYKN